MIEEMFRISKAISVFRSVFLPIKGVANPRI
jgi:hypothetical protein